MTFRPLERSRRRLLIASLAALIVLPTSILAALIPAGTAAASGGSGSVATFAGAGFTGQLPAQASSLDDQPRFLAKATVSGVPYVYFIDSVTSDIYRINETTGVESWVAGEGGPTAGVNILGNHIAVDSSGDVFVAASCAIDYIPASTGTAWGISMTAGDQYQIAGQGTGTGTCGYSDGGALSSAAFFVINSITWTPYGLVVQNAGSGYHLQLLASQTCSSNCAFGLSATAPDTVYTIAGNGSGPGTTTFGGSALATSSASNVLTSDASGNVFIGLDSTSQVALIAATTSSYGAQSVTAGDIYLIAGTSSPGYSGDGSSALSAQVTTTALAVDGSGNLYIFGGQAIREVPPTGGTFFGQGMTAGDIYTIAGNGTATTTPQTGNPLTSELSNNMSNALVDPAGNLIVSENFTPNTYELQMLPDETGSVLGSSVTADTLATVAGSTSIGNGGPAVDANVWSPFGVSLDAGGDVFFADTGHNQIREVPASSGTFYGQAMTAGDIYTIAGGGAGAESGANGASATSIALTNSGGVSYVTGDGLLFSTTGALWYLASETCASSCPLGLPSTTAGDMYLIAGNAGGAETSNPVALNGGAAASTEIPYQPARIAADPQGDLIFGSEEWLELVAEHTGTAYGVPVTAGDVYVIAGTSTTTSSGDNGPLSSATFHSINSVATDPSGNIVLLDGDEVRLVAAANGTAYNHSVTANDIYQLAGVAQSGGYTGDGSAATGAKLTSPNDAQIDAAGNILIADFGDQAIRMIAGSNETDLGQSMTAGDIYTIVGTGTAGYTGENVTPATEELSDPTSIAVTSGGDVYVAQFGLSRIFDVDPLNEPVSQSAPTPLRVSSHAIAVNQSASYTFSVAGTPTPEISESGTLPTGVTFTDNGDGTATISGTPTADGTFPINVSAWNAAGATGPANFNLVVAQSAAPSFASSSSTTFNEGSADSFTVSASGVPTPTLSESGTLPTGVTFTDNGDGTATISGTPTADGTFPITITASNGTSAPQSFSILVPQSGNGGGTTTTTTAPPGMGVTTTTPADSTSTPSNTSSSSDASTAAASVTPPASTVKAPVPRVSPKTVTVEKGKTVTLIVAIPAKDKGKVTVKVTEPGQKKARTITVAINRYRQVDLRFAGLPLGSTKAVVSFRGHSIRTETVHVLKPRPKAKARK